MLKRVRGMLDKGEPGVEKTTEPEKPVRKVDEEFLDKKRLFGLLGTKKADLRQPLLLLIRESGDIEIHENVPSGEFHILNEDTNTDKMIILTNSKLLSLDYGKRSYTTWVAYENEATPYPVNVKHDSGTLVQLVAKVSNELEDLNRPENLKAKYNFIIMMVVIGLIALLLAANYGVFNNLFGGASVLPPPPPVQNVTVIQ